MKADSDWPQSGPVRGWMYMLGASCAGEGKGRHHDVRNLPYFEIMEAAKADTTTNLGRTHAQSGHVTALNVYVGQVSAWVQEPGEFTCRVDMWIDVINTPAWKRLAESLSTRPDMASEILTRRMPDHIEYAFESAGLRLFPTRDEIKVECLCSDGAKLCRHAMAAFFVLAQECEHNPFLMFALRGCDITDLLEAAGLSPTPEAMPEISSDPDEPTSEPLPADPDVFWGRNADAYDHGDAFILATNAVAPKMLGEFPFWQGSDDFTPIIERIYREASQDGMRLFRGEPRDGI